MHPPLKYQFAVVCALLIALSVPRALQAQACSGNCADFYNLGSSFPFEEHVTLPETVDIQGSANPNIAQFVPVSGPCTTFGDVNGAATFNVALRAHLEVTSSTAPLGSHFDAQLLLLDANNNDAFVGGDSYTRLIRYTSYSSDLALPQSEWFNTVVTNVPPGNYHYQLKVRLDADATMRVSVRFTTAFGSPSIYGGAKQLNAAALTVPNYFITAVTANITNNSGVPADLQLQGYFAITGGYANDKILVGLGLDGNSSNGHNTVVYVPCTDLNCTAAMLPQGVNVVDHVPNEGMGVTLPADGQPHTVSLYLENMSGHTTTVQWAQISAIGFPSNNGLVYFPAKNSTPLAVVPGTVAFPQPEACIFLDSDDTPKGSLNVCSDGTTVAAYGAWTRVLGPFSIPAGTYNVTGDGYLELLGRDKPTDPAWAANRRAQIGIEVVTADGKGADWHFVGFDVPATPTHVYFFADAQQFGSFSGPMTVNLWVRKVSPAAGSPVPNTSFQIGRANMGLRVLNVNDASCLNTN